LVKTHVEESLGANPGDAALNPADSVAMGVPSSRAPRRRPSGRAFRALAHREYRLLFAAFMVNQTGFWISHISIQALMASLSGNSAARLGQLFFAMFLPAFILAPLAGVAADRFDRKRILLLCYGGVVGVVALLAALTGLGRIDANTLLWLGFGLGTAFAFSGPASAALAANAVPAEDLSSAVSLQSAANNITRVVGPALAAPILLSGRYEISFGVFAVAALFAALLTAMLRVPGYQPEEEEGGLFARLRAGLRHARERRPALPALITVATLSFFGVSHVALLSVFAEDVLGDVSWFAWIASSAGVGAIAGALVTGSRSTTPTLRGATLQTACFGVALLVFAQSRVPWLALGSQVVLGYFYFAVMTSLQTLIQEIVAENRRGRVMSLFQVAWGGIVPFGGLALGQAGEWFGVAITLSGGALACIVYGLAMTAIAPRLGDRPGRTRA